MKPILKDAAFFVLIAVVLFLAVRFSMYDTGLTEHPMLAAETFDGYVNLELPDSDQRVSSEQEY